MTKINDYLWHLPHTPLDDDPVDVLLLQQSFNLPIVSALQEPLAEMGYQLKSNDVVVQLSEPLPEGTRPPFRANIRFLRYLEADVIVRVHFEHMEWAHFLPGHNTHRYVINLDRFKIADPRTQVVVPAWPGRLHTRMSNRLDNTLHHAGEDQVWAFSSAEELEEQMNLFLRKFAHLAKPWLEAYATF